MTEYILIISFLFDTIIGDPRTKYHPVVLLGNLISFIEKSLLSMQDKVQTKKIKGGILVIVVLVTVYLITDLIVMTLHNLNYISYIAISGMMLSFTISPRSLAEAGVEIKKYLSLTKMEISNYLIIKKRLLYIQINESY